MQFAYNVAANGFANAFGYTANTVVAVANFTNTGRKGNRVNRAYNAFWHIVALLCVGRVAGAFAT